MANILDSNPSYPIVLGMSGASGAVYGLRLLKFLLSNNYQVEFTLSANALIVIKEELGIEFELDDLSNSILTKLELKEFTHNFRLHSVKNIAASISSGSYKTQGMIVAPCSMGTIANIAAGTSHNLISRAADVTLKERRKLILLVREAPYSTIHLRNMLSLSELGAVIVPASPGFYHNPKSIDDQINFVLGKALDVMGIDNSLFKRWQENNNGQQ